MPASDDYVASVLAASPVAFWKCQDASGNPVDSSGNGFDCDSVSGTPDYHLPGPMSDFSIFCAAGEKLNRTAQVSTVIDNFSMEMWVYPIFVSAGGRTMFGNGFTAATGWGISIELDTRFKSEISDGAANGKPSQEKLPSNRWSHIGVVRNGGDWEYYCNGKQDSVGNGPVAPGIPAGPIQIGAGSALDFRVAYVAVYETVLTTATFAEHYSFGAPVPTSNYSQFPKRVMRRTRVAA